MIFWTKEDSANLASIARSLEKLTERELERNLAPRFIPETSVIGFKDRIKSFIGDKEDKIQVLESPSLEDEALEEAIKKGQKMQAKVSEAHRTGNVPYVVEDLFDVEELESL